MGPIAWFHHKLYLFQRFLHASPVGPILRSPTYRRLTRFFQFLIFLVLVVYFVFVDNGWLEQHVRLADNLEYKPWISVTIMAQFIGMLCQMPLESSKELILGMLLQVLWVLVGLGSLCRAFFMVGAFLALCKLAVIVYNYLSGQDVIWWWFEEPIVFRRWTASEKEDIFVNIWKKMQQHYGPGVEPDLEQVFRQTREQKLETREALEQAIIDGFAKQAELSGWSGANSLWDYWFTLPLTALLLAALCFLGYRLFKRPLTQFWARCVAWWRGRF